MKIGVENKHRILPDDVKGSFFKHKSILPEDFKEGFLKHKIFE